MAMTHDEFLEHVLDAERAVIGALLIDESIVRDVMSTVDDRDFLNETNRLVFRTARKLFRSGDAVDAITIRDRMGSQYSQYLADLMEITPTAANWRDYAASMHHQAALQRAKDLAQQITEAVTLDDCRQPCADLEQVLADGRKTESMTMRDLLDDFFKSQDPDQPAAEYITTGFEAIDVGSYMELGDVVMLGGYPSDGKTALALMLAYRMAERYKVGFFSLETDNRKVRDRMVATAAQIDFNDIKRKTLADADWKALADKSADFCKRDFTVLQASGMTATEIQAVSQAYGFQIVIIDYVQLITPEVDRRAPRSEQMADVSRSLHTFARKSKTMVLELAQLTRQERSSGWREPDMHDLKESGQFEQDADMIFLLFRPNPNSDELDQEKNRIFKIAKNKEGRRGKWPLYFDGSTQTFSVMVSDDGKQVMRDLVAAGKAAKQKNRREARGQQTMPEFRELRGDDAKGVPF